MLYYIYGFDITDPICKFYLIEPIKQRIFTIKNKQYNILLPEILWEVKTVYVSGSWVYRSSKPIIRAGEYPWKGDRFIYSQIALPNVFVQGESYCAGDIKINNQKTLQKLFNIILEAYWATEFNGDLLRSDFLAGTRFEGKDQLLYYLSKPSSEVLQRKFLFNVKEGDVV